MPLPPPPQSSLFLPLYLPQESSKKPYLTHAVYVHIVQRTYKNSAVTKILIQIFPVIRNAQHSSWRSASTPGRPDGGRGDHEPGLDAH